MAQALPFAEATQVGNAALNIGIFAAFVVVHVALVLATGALRNLNAMFASRDADDWVGFGIFALALLAIAGGWALVRPAIVDRIAGAFGDVMRRG